MAHQFRQITWDDGPADDWQTMLRLAVAEDVGTAGDCTSAALVPADANGGAAIVARRSGVIAGLPGIEPALRQFEPRLKWAAELQDGRSVEPGDRIGLISGPAGGILTAERTVLNLLGRLSGIATLTRRYVDAVSGTAARIYDTRKTTPGWRRLEKYAVGCGGGYNHRSGLFDAILIKDNHLAFGRPEEDGATSVSTGQYSPAEAVARAHRFVQEHCANAPMVVEIEVDTLDQLDQVLPARPDIVLLDNMSAADLREAVSRRNKSGASTELEASGGVHLDTVAQIAATGVDRISVGALTHSAASLDLGLDWLG